MTSLNDVQKLFPSEDGNRESRENVLQLVTTLLENMDRLKRPDYASLGHEKQREANFYQQLVQTAEVPLQGESLSHLVDSMTSLMTGHPYHSRYFLTNVLPMASIPGLIGQLTASLLNGNNLWDVYGPAGAEAETKVIAMMSRIAGYDVNESWGYTTWGGQGAVFTGLRLAIAKHCPDAVEHGVPDNLYVFSSEQAHYSLIKSAEATGIGRSHVIKVRTKRDHSMDEQDLASKMTEVIEEGGKPVYVVATTGTTDNFGIDNIQAIKDTTDALTNMHALAPVHIHADSALGGFYAFFNEYDFTVNSLNFDENVLKGLRTITSKMKHLHLADSLCFDFQKLGQTPYATSLFLVKNKEDLSLIDLDAAESPYVGDRGYGDYHTSYTLECSRMASSIAIMAALQLFGVEGYQILLANYIKVNITFREKLLAALPDICVTNPLNPGPITAFRLYQRTGNWEMEATGQLTKEEIMKTNRRNEALFEYFGTHRARIFLGDTKKFALVTCKDQTELQPVYVSKFFTISPYTETEHVPDVITFIQDAIEATKSTETEVTFSC
ncbi:pyridoxal-dependent decarboxylase [Salipaludibacillus sp. LMS25]|uniref:pyridoxal phosphate-dependent decarboxylase family protein n=1 Tax=Salipaludibacillus sp. LMS25 TaxID=2924031 RepID=UPI0020D06113|nr:pyridoxal-dependent decarboxylase [Salipaludibacillus sp. LMS25]UTR16363.1 pyridoxal-dependent decarboxylase [Salipaludibacillus sp. LMS25]